jgi:hypothetical protein
MLARYKITRKGRRFLSQLEHFLGKTIECTIASILEDKPCRDQDVNLVDKLWGLGVQDRVGHESLVCLLQLLCLCAVLCDCGQVALVVHLLA